ncbi:SDR family oxidoreductase [Caulobacter soli]|uniref:SDR family oxidoreductase n=1 Tax=Caulobacter soli TaxID=2708539 RepID=UPI0013EB47C5|nr:SDR family oxidoreductase [Caulobacter soli]
MSANLESNITGKVVVVTGASSGLGEATARHLAAKGARLVLAARRIDRLEALVAEIVAAGGQAIAVQTDVTVKADADAMIAAAVKAFGRVDVLVNNAGLMAIAPMSATKVDEWDRMIDINIKGVLYGIAAALPVFEAQGSGQFVNISSIAGRKVFSPGGTVYSGTKFAVSAISEGLRHEVGGKIRVTVISPGVVDSELRHGSSDPDALKGLEDFYQIAIPANAIARAIAYAVEQPADVDVSEIAVRPTLQDF